MCPVAVDTRRMLPPSSNEISGSVLIVAARVVVVVVAFELGLLPLLRCDSGEEGGVSVGNRSEAVVVVARATNLNSMAFGWWW